VINGQNFPFSIGRHVAISHPAATEFIVSLLEHPLGTCLPLLKHKR
jgi:hypothetical protein